MTFSAARQRFQIPFMDEAALNKPDQEEAFDDCVRLLSNVPKTKSQNRGHSTYGLKHIVESPTGRYGIPTDPRVHDTYVYEGTFILAALASGFTLKFIYPRSIGGTLNLSNPGLKRALQRFVSDKKTRLGLA